MCHAVLGDNSHSQTGDKLMYAVVYLLVNVVGSACEDYDIASLCTGLFDYLPCLCRYIVLIA